MKNCNKLLALALSVLAVAACADKACIRGTLEGAANSKIVVKQLDINSYRNLDTVKTGANGSFRYDVKVAAGQPEFIYLFYGDTRVAALLLEKGEKVTVQADTLGRYTVSGSEGSAELAKVDKAYSDFIANLHAHESEPTAMTRDYIQHYRDNVKYVMEHPYSLTTVPVFFERLGDASIFSQVTDAILFRKGADSLKTVYPDSRYVKALDKEAARRMRLLEINGQLQTAAETSFPDIVLPDINGEKRSLSEVDAKVILVHFWDASDAAQKMFSIDTLLPLYRDFHNRGFEIYSICCTPDKPEWASSVLAQKLPWINVNDGMGGASPAVVTYGVNELPYSFLIIDGEINTRRLGGIEGLRKELSRLLK
ncbi:MAG: AhpC/TSA family protein [Bacteroidales bacterium]|nr:AhpC/TSA family protein [Bacteroidales bacterium]